MNPNSQHQLWTMWEYSVIPDPPRHPSFAQVQANCVRFARLAFGSAGQIRIVQQRRAWHVKVLAEGLPGHDPAFADWMHAQWLRFFQNGFGAACRVTHSVKVMAGDAQNGLPPEQMLIVPTIVSSASEDR